MTGCNVISGLPQSHKSCIHKQALAGVMVYMATTSRILFFGPFVIICQINEWVVMSENRLEKIANDYQNYKCHVLAYCLHLVDDWFYYMLHCNIHKFKHVVGF
ncbi:hypothetical protein ACJX0J_006678 [Zea mays]